MHLIPRLDLFYTQKRRKVLTRKPDQYVKKTIGATLYATYAVKYWSCGIVSSVRNTSGIPHVAENTLQVHFHPIFMLS